MFSKSGSPEAGAASQRSLIFVTGAHLALAALVSFAILSALCLSENWLDEGYYTRWYGKVEIARISNALMPDGRGGLKIDVSKPMPHYQQSPNKNAYAFAIWDEFGRTVASANADALTQWSPIPRQLGANMPDTWQKKFGSRWFETVSGRRVDVEGQRLWIEVGTQGDPDRIRFSALWADFVHDVFRPLAPTFLAAMLLALLSLRRALRPVTEAARAAARLTPRADTGALALPTAGLPREVATLANAVNELLGRVNDLVQSQSEFIGRAAHQLRTPLATMMLEVERSGLSSAPELHRDLERMSETVDKLLELARMQAAPLVTAGVLNLRELADDVAMDLNPLAQERGGTVSVTGARSVNVHGDYCTLREAVANVVGNAIVHHPGRPHVLVTCGPGARIVIDDDGTGLVGISAHAAFEPFARGSSGAHGTGLGLALVKRIVELHRGSVTAGRSPAGGAQFAIDLLGAQNPDEDPLRVSDELPQAAE